MIASRHRCKSGTHCFKRSLLELISQLLVDIGSRLGMHGLSPVLISRCPLVPWLYNTPSSGRASMAGLLTVTVLRLPSH